jgi:hypothetical protein
MGQLESYFGRRGQYEEAAMVNGAARRLRADDDDKRRMEAEIAAGMTFDEFARLQKLPMPKTAEA